jgi:decaprenyl-phosphate phosphoribosyltransferase
LLSSFFYSLSSSFFLGVFLIKYRIEYLISFPFFAGLFTWYFFLGMKFGSVAKDPEKLFQEKEFMLFLGFLICLIAMLTLVDIPSMHFLMEQVNF